MRLILLTQYYPPETGAPQNRLHDLSRRLVSMGHDVTVLSAMPNYPAGRIQEGYRGRLFMSEEIDGVKVLRSWIFATKSRRFIPWVSHYFSFVFTSLLFGAVKLPRADVLITESPPLFLGITGYLLAKLKRATFVLNVADLWPKAGVDLGLLKSPLQIGVLNFLERVLYARAKLVTGQTQGIVEHVEEVVPTKKTWLLPNGADTERLSPDGGDPGYLKEFGLSDKFVVGYGGLHGPAQSLKTVVDSARHLQDHPDIVIALFGDGPEKSDLIQRARLAGLHNVLFFPLQAGDRMPGLVPLWDVGLVPLYDGKLMELARPSKMFEIMACGVPLILCAPPGEASEIVQGAGAGLWVAAEDPAALATAILELHGDPALRSRLSSQGRCLIESRFDRRVIAEEFAGHLAGATG
jgi:glycosyltransferase involved in cell wall biosynthesis